MKLLIVDDEELTREGLISSISWDELGFSSVFQADDGVNGLAVALKEAPQIVLCDVRMPRMDGIHMAEQIREQLPDTVIIFMSGYSDKEYLKAAIKLKAINYVEKPLNLGEIKQAVLEGIHSYRQNQQSMRSVVWKHLENSARLALALTGPYKKNETSIRDLCQELSLENMDKSWFTTFLLKPIVEAPDEESFHIITEQISKKIVSLHLSLLSIERHHQYLIYHVYGLQNPSKHTLEKVASLFLSELQSQGDCYLCIGDTVCGIQNAYRSYESAVLLMQSSFFFAPDMALCKEDLNKTFSQEALSSFFAEDYSASFYDALLSKDQDACASILNHIHDFFYHNNQVLADQAKDLYYKLFTMLQNARRKMKMPEENITDGPEETIIRYLERFSSYTDMHKALLEKMEHYFSDINTVSEDNSTIFLIKDYIGKNYQNEKLSVKDISDHVYLSTSYVCTLFKGETGKTLNQYIMEYRMEKAKKLLMDPRFKITDISSRVGYSDGNYFGKSFKKATGLSPSEYREKMTR